MCNGEKHVSTRVNFCVFGSKIENWRCDVASGNSFAEGLSDPALQNAGFDSGRRRAEYQTRPSASNIGLWTIAWLSQISSSPQYGDGASCEYSSFELEVFGSMTGSRILDATALTGSSTGMSSVLSSGE